MMSMSFATKQTKPPQDGLVSMPRPTSATFAHQTGAWCYGGICPQAQSAVTVMDEATPGGKDNVDNVLSGNNIPSATRNAAAFSPKDKIFSQEDDSIS